MPAPRAWLIDASIYIFRAWFSLPDRWHTKDGMPLNALYGYVGFLLDFLDATELPPHCAAAFDESLGSCFRNEILSSYKSSREFPDEALAFQLSACRQATECLRIPCYSGSRYEADDYLASLARICRAQGMDITVVTRDKDLGQILVGPNDHWWDFAGGITLDSEAFAAKHGVRPDQFADYLALVGDPVDDIAGVPGVGAKTAASLLAVYETLDALELGLDSVATLDIRGAKSLQAKLQAHWPQARLAQQLTILADSIPEVTEAPSYQPNRGDAEALVAYLDSLQLQGPLLRRCEKMARTLPA
jgi:5'-3' exonuclease